MLDPSRYKKQRFDFDWDFGRGNFFWMSFLWAAVGGVFLLCFHLAGEPTKLISGRRLGGVLLGKLIFDGYAWTDRYPYLFPILMLIVFGCLNALLERWVNRIMAFLTTFLVFILVGYLAGS